MTTQTTTFNWGKLLKVLITVLTALAGALGVASCAV
ncbi:MAG: smalltalk protein [Bacteroidaceae bacterium]|nr:smalltalk protein [Bacteroidaceae bacterium]